MNINVSVQTKQCKAELRCWDSRVHSNSTPDLLPFTRFLSVPRLNKQLQYQHHQPASRGQQKAATNWKLPILIDCQAQAESADQIRLELLVRDIHPCCTCMHACYRGSNHPRMLGHCSTHGMGTSLLIIMSLLILIIMSLLITENK